MGRHDRRDGLKTRARESSEVANLDVCDDEASDDAQDQGRRRASDTAELLIVNQERVSAQQRTKARTERYLAALRQRVDTGDYALLPRLVAEAMVQCADDLDEE